MLFALQDAPQNSCATCKFSRRPRGGLQQPLREWEAQAQMHKRNNYVYELNAPGIIARERQSRCHTLLQFESRWNATEQMAILARQMDWALQTTCIIVQLQQVYSYTECSAALAFNLVTGHRWCSDRSSNMATRSDASPACVRGLSDS